MKVRPYNENRAKTESIVDLKLVLTSAGVDVIAVDAYGIPIPYGVLAAITTDGILRIRDLNSGLGFDTDDWGHIRDIGEAHE